MPKIIKINGINVDLGEQKEISLRIARLPTHTTIDLPIYVNRGHEDGPVLLITAGLHGDELNGIEIARKLMADNLALPDRGTTIVMPVVNIYGFLQNTRALPDGKDLNRSFPGNKTGSLARRVAYALINEILPQVDFGLDFHTGGASRSNHPQVRSVLSDPVNLKLARAFAPPMIVNSKFIDKSYRKAAHRRGKHVIVYEAGESMRFDQFAISEGIDGTLRLMKHLEMIENAPDPHDSIIIKNSRWVRSRYAGMFHTDVNLGQKVKKRQQLGRVTDPFGETEYKVKSTLDGYVIGLNHMPVMNAGDALMHIGMEA